MRSVPNERSLTPGVLASMATGLALIFTSAIATSALTSFATIAGSIMLGIVTMYVAAGLRPPWSHRKKKADAVDPAVAALMNAVTERIGQIERRVDATLNAATAEVAEAQERPDATEIIDKLSRIREQRGGGRLISLSEPIIEFDICDCSAHTLLSGWPTGGIFRGFPPIVSGDLHEHGGWMHGAVFARGGQAHGTAFERAVGEGLWLRVADAYREGYAASPERPEGPMIYIVKVRYDAHVPGVTYVASPMTRYRSSLSEHLTSLRALSAAFKGVAAGGAVPPPPAHP